jgi:hypothetical protein
MCDEVHDEIWGNEYFHEGKTFYFTSELWSWNWFSGIDRPDDRGGIYRVQVTVGVLKLV